MRIETFALATLACFCAAEASAQSAKNVPPSSITDKAKDVHDSVVLVGLSKEFVVDGDTAYDSYFLGAEKITFKPGARLIFSEKALKLRPNLIVAAKSISMDDQAKPGVITWDRGQGPSAPPPSAGQAPGGSHGVGDGQSGGPGSNGAIGGQGISGENGPNLTLFVTQFINAPPVIDVSGQAGGIGDTGQAGGDGGVGHKGSPASENVVNCTSGAGYGGNGGVGGNGGTGGTGGTGGAGGTVTLVSLPTAFPAVLQLVRVITAGGTGGDGGNGGPGGKGALEAVRVIRPPILQR